MSKLILIDSAHPEEIRAALVDGNKLDRFDFTSSSKVQIKGNVYLGKIVRVEPSLQAAFVDFGGDKHGFLSFSEIHHDYFQIPIGDRDELKNKIQEAIAARAEGPANEKGADEDFDAREIAKLRYQFYRRYKIQEVIKKRQIVLVQVTKEARGVKGASLTTYISLAGRYCVLMPNMAKENGVSRRISNPKDRTKMKNVVSGLSIENGSVIIRTAGVGHTKLEIKKDFEYLKGLWDEIRNTTLHSIAPSLIYEEANIIKRALRDFYNRDVESIIVEGEAGYKFAKDLVKKLMPSHAKKVKLYDDPKLPLFSKYHINEQVNQIYSTKVDLPSGGYLVINTTEALVSIDVNSGRSTRARDISGTAIKTNLEAAVEIARQCRLRDLAGLIVVDFIDMEEKRDNTQVERCLREALRDDKARIQVGLISNFGLLEFSRQRLRSSIADANMLCCPHCNGTGIIWSNESIALQILRKVEETCMAIELSEVIVTISGDIALYLLNNKKDFIASIEKRGLKVRFAIDPSISAADFRIEQVAKPINTTSTDEDDPIEVDISEKRPQKTNKKAKTKDHEERSVTKTEKEEENQNHNNRKPSIKQRTSENVTQPKNIDNAEISVNPTTYKSPKKRWNKSRENEEAATVHQEGSSKPVLEIVGKKKKKESKVITKKKETTEPVLAEVSTSEIISKEEKKIDKIIEIYKEVESSINNSYMEPTTVLPSLPSAIQSKGKKSGWWTKLLKPTEKTENSDTDSNKSEQ